MPEMRMMATTGMLGYGYTEEAFRRGLEQKPDFIAADGGSMDPGPYYLGEGIPFVSRKAMKRRRWMHSVRQPKPSNLLWKPCASPSKAPRSSPICARFRTRSETLQRFGRPRRRLGIF